MAFYGRTRIGGVNDRRCAAFTRSGLTALVCAAASCVGVSACGGTEGNSDNTTPPQPNAIATDHSVPVSPSDIKKITRHLRGTGTVTATTPQKPVGAATGTVANAVTGCLSRAGIIGAPDHKGSAPTQGLIKSGAPVTTSEYTATLRRCGLSAGRR